MLAARTQRALTFSSDFATNVNNILNHTRQVHAASCSGESDDLVITLGPHSAAALVLGDLFA